MCKKYGPVEDITSVLLARNMQGNLNSVQVTGTRPLAGEPLTS